MHGGAIFGGIGYFKGGKLGLGSTAALAKKAPEDFRRVFL